MSEIAGSSLTSELVEIRDRTRAFIREVVVPAEPRDSGEHLDAKLRAELQEQARLAGVFAPQVAKALGGMGLDHFGRSVVFEEAGYSLLGPHALNCAAPDEGNMHLLQAIGTSDQITRYLTPLATGRVRSCFAMTEPHPGAGSDPAMLRTTAHQMGDGWVLNGAKRFISGAEGAGFAICMARTDDAPSGETGATMFIVEAGTAGYHVERRIPTVDRAFVGGHSEVRFENCIVPSSAVLGEVGLGYRYAQVRLGPARLTHCMRWLGIAVRALEVALDRIAEREAFGARLDELGMVQAMVADSVIDIEASRALIRACAGLLDGGSLARNESSIAKVFVSEAVSRVVDRAVQMCGGDGVSHDLPLARFLSELRPFRIYDGPSEVHRMAIARRASRNRREERGS